MRAVFMELSMKKRISFIMALCLMLLCLSGCGGVVSVAASPVPEAQRTGITVWYTDDGGRLWDGFEAAVASYNAGDGAISGVKVTVKSYASDAELIAALSDGKTGNPDAVLCGLDAGLGVTGGSTAQYFSASSLGAVGSEYLKACEISGKLVCVPVFVSPELLMVNEPLLAKLGGQSQAELASFEGVCSWAEKYNDLTGDHFLTADSYTSLFRAGLAQYGDEFHASRELDIKNSHYVYLYNLLAEAAYHGGVTSADTAAGKLVAEGKIACATVSAADVMDNAPSAKAADIGILPYPVVNGGKKLCPAKLVCASITADDEKAQAACAVFISWLINNGSSVAGDSGYFSTAQKLSSVSAANDSKYRELYGKTLDAVKDMAGAYSVTFPASDTGNFAADAQFEASFRETLNGLN